MKTIFLVFLFLVSSTVFCTVDYLCFNSITKELYWADDDNPSGFIAWENLPENYEPHEKAKLAEGYTYTTFPFKLEAVILTVFVVLLLLVLLFARQKK